MVFLHHSRKLKPFRESRITSNPGPIGTPVGRHPHVIPQLVPEPRDDDNLVPEHLGLVSLPVHEADTAGHLSPGDSVGRCPDVVHLRGVAPVDAADHLQQRVLDHAGVRPAAPEGCVVRARQPHQAVQGVPDVFECVGLGLARDHPQFVVEDQAGVVEPVSEICVFGYQSPQSAVCGLPHIAEDFFVGSSAHNLYCVI